MPQARNVRKCSIVRDARGWVGGWVGGGWEVGGGTGVATDV